MWEVHLTVGGAPCTGGPGQHRKAVCASVENKPVSCHLHSFLFTSCLQVPAWTYLDNGLQAVRLNEPFPPQVAFAHGVLS